MPAASTGGVNTGVLIVMLVSLISIIIGVVAVADGLGITVVVGMLDSWNLGWVVVVRVVANTSRSVAWPVRFSEGNGIWLSVWHH
jgi:hypothetical protein